MGVTGIDATADGIPQRLSVAIGVDQTRDDIRSSVLQRDLGPLNSTIYFVYRETGTEDWNFITDGTTPRYIRGRSAQTTFENGMWAFEVENRNHDADRLLTDIWSDAVQQARYSGDKFFEFAASIEEGLEIDWPN